MTVAKEQIPSLFIGEHPIKTVMVGNAVAYERPGGYVYIKLDTSAQTPSATNSK